MRNRRNGFDGCLKAKVALAVLLGAASGASAAGNQCQSNTAARQSETTDLIGGPAVNCTCGAGSNLFRGVPIDPPGTSRTIVVYSVTNIRANATRLAVHTGIGHVGIPIYMTISVNYPRMAPINNPQRGVAFPQRADVHSNHGRLRFQGAPGISSQRADRTLPARGDA